MENGLVMDRASFLAWAEAQPRGRFERVAGEVIRTPPERVEHVSLKSQIWLALYQALRGNSGYHAYNDGMTVSIDQDTDFEPDVSVNAGPKLAKGELVLSNPVIVVEVLSPSSHRADIAVKQEKYLGVPSIEHYLVFRTDRQEVIHWRRGGAGPQIRTEGALPLDPPGIAINIDDIYRLAEEQ